MLQLICHPETPAVTVESIEVWTKRLENGRLWFRFHLEGQLEALELDEQRPPERTDELWRSTCFEAFLRKSGHDSYLEYNFAPSSQWAAYAFADYRSGGTDLCVKATPEIFLDASEGHFALETEIILAPDWQDEPIDLNLTAVIEETNGTKSYWALAHPPGKPDFHHKDCFALKLEAPRGA
jgi:hypothetical protein